MYHERNVCRKVGACTTTTIVWYVHFISRQPEKHFRSKLSLKRRQEHGESHTQVEWSKGYGILLLLHDAHAVARETQPMILLLYLLLCVSIDVRQLQQHYLPRAFALEWTRHVSQENNLMPAAKSGLKKKHYVSTLEKPRGVSRSGQTSNQVWIKTDIDFKQSAARGSSPAGQPEGAGAPRLQRMPQPRHRGRSGTRRTARRPLEARGRCPRRSLALAMQPWMQEPVVCIVGRRGTRSTHV